MKKKAQFRNWAGLVTASPQDFYRPGTVEEVCQVVRELGRGAGRSVRTVGAGHSFTPVAAGEDAMMNLDALSGIVSVDREHKRVRFLAGTRLRDVPGLLAPFGLALENQGDVDPQSLAGAVSTSTHGTGLAFTGFAGTVTALTLVDAAGELRTFSLEEDPDLLRLVVVSVGALGVLVEVELQCVDAFDLAADESSAGIDDVLDSFVERARSADHFECYWFPHTDRAMTKTNTRCAPGGSTRHGWLGRVQRTLDEEVINNGAFAASIAAGRAVPGAIPALNRLATAAISHNHYRAPAHEVFVTPRRVRFHEMEFSVPLADGPEVVREIRRLIDARRWQIAFPLELRATAADDVALSTSQGRESMYIAVHVPRSSNPADYFPHIEPLLLAAEGRPHWGKMHTLGQAELAKRYPRFEEFCQLREQLDPQRRFGSEYLRALFG